MSSIFNDYISGVDPYETVPEDTPPGPEGLFSLFTGGQTKGALTGFLERFGLSRIDTGDLILLLLLYLLLKEEEGSDPVLLLALAAAFFLGGEG